MEQVWISGTPSPDALTSTAASAHRRWTVFALSFCLLAAACNKKDADDETKKAASAVPDVTVTKVKRATIAGDLIVNGNLAALPNRPNSSAIETRRRLAMLPRSPERAREVPPPPDAAAFPTLTHRTGPSA